MNDRVHFARQMKAKLKRKRGLSCPFTVHHQHPSSDFGPGGIMKEKLVFNRGGLFPWGGDRGGWSSFPTSILYCLYFS